MKTSLRPLALGALIGLSLIVGCNAKVATVLGDPSGSESGSRADGGGVGLPDEDRPLVPASKVDLLLVVDNSASMADKSSLLANSIGTLIRDVATVGDVHVGVLSSSLGNFGGDVCLEQQNPETNGRAHLRTTDSTGATVPGAETGVLSYTGGSVDSFVSSAEALVRGVGERGCGLEAQLETMYRFLVQPDPWTTVRLDSFNQATFGPDVDADVLTQRKAFLRPDSALVIVMITDEDDSSVDPLAIGGQGWAFMAKSFPGSKVFRGGAAQGTTAPRGTSTCVTDPKSTDCTSCGFAPLCDQSDPKCQKLRSDPNCTTSGNQGQSGDGYNGYYGPSDDELNVRFHRMKERYGIDPQYPIARYIAGLTNSMVPDRKSEHVENTDASGRRTIADYTGTAKCTNPIFAAQLPSTAGDEVCSLPRGPRSRELVVFALLGGLPPELATDTPNWTTILGQDPDNFNYDGIDMHMVQSTVPRPGLAGPTSTGTDPVHGREWNTNKSDLQYACTFLLPQPRTCTPANPSCDCNPDSTLNPPLCGSPGQQVRGKAYPTIRPLRLARGLGDRGVVGSVCSDSYETTMTLLGQRLAPRLAR